MRAFLTTGGPTMPEELGPRGETPDLIGIGTPTMVVKRRWGQGGLGVEWSRMPFGMTAWASDRVMSHALLERVAQVQGWEGVATRLCAVPIFGYRWLGSDAWTKIAPGWALGFFEEGDSAGFLLAADEVDGLRHPVVAEWSTTRTWLLSEKWQQMKLLRAAAEMCRSASERSQRRAG
jgi:hypothetical protein